LSAQAADNKQQFLSNREAIVRSSAVIASRHKRGARLVAADADAAAMTAAVAADAVVATNSPK
jgi:hypothetical protein